VRIQGKERPEAEKPSTEGFVGSRYAIFLQRAQKNAFITADGHKR